ncbi:hypothetical protein DRO59_08575 [Candidatus Bathyarchaeota archaeon]|nr:MAG: hypothetical protein DRO59_08575 [Candidatus Bathyarchaeota archaeon]
MKIGFRKFGEGPDRDVGMIEVPRSVLLLINGQPGVAVEDLRDVSISKLNKLVRKRSTLVSGTDAGFMIVRYKHLVEVGLVQPSSWVDPDATEILLFIKDDERAHVVWIHTHRE